MIHKKEFIVNFIEGIDRLIWEVYLVTTERIEFGKNSNNLIFILENGRVFRELNRSIIKANFFFFFLQKELLKFVDIVQRIDQTRAEYLFQRDFANK